MSDTPMKAVVNCATNQVENVPLTDEEIASLEEARAEFEKMEAERIAAEQAKAEAKATASLKLTSLGLSEEEIKSILG